MLLFFFASYLSQSFAAQKMSQELSISWPVSKRKGRSNCWAQLESIDHQGNRVLICISKKLWRRYLNRSDALCDRGKWVGRKKLWETKTDDDVLYRWFFQVEHFPEACESTRFARWFKYVEVQRERLHVFLEPFDRLGVLRKLMINQSAEGSAHFFLRVLGFVHLVSVAGIHLYAIFRWLERLQYGLVTWGRLSYRWISPISRLFQILLITWIWLLEGMRPGMLRPIGVIALRRIAMALGFRWSVYTPLVAICIFDLIIEFGNYLIDSDGYWSPGRIHYFLAVWGGLFAVAPLWDRKSKENKSILREHLLLSVGSWIPTAVYDVISSHLFAVFTPLISMVTVPIFTVIVFPLMLLCFSFQNFTWAENLAMAIGQGAQWVIESCFEWSISLKSLWVIQLFPLVLGFLVFILSCWVGIKLRIVLLIVLFSLCLFRITSDSPFEKVRFASEVEQLDIGQGDALWVKWGHERFGMFDAGSVWSLSAEEWFQFLVQRDALKLDWVGLSHFDEDHRGGLNHLLRLVPVGEVIASNVSWVSPRGRRLRSKFESHGVKLSVWEQSHFPFHFFHSKGSSKPNGLMTGIRIPTKCGQYFNFGDASGEDEMEMLRDLGELPSGKRILKISHHGSRFSSSETFLRELKPDIAWISCGRRNAFGHPSIQVLQRLRAEGISVFSTYHSNSLKLGQCKSQ